MILLDWIGPRQQTDALKCQNFEWFETWNCHWERKRKRKRERERDRETEREREFVCGRESEKREKKKTWISKNKIALLAEANLDLLFKSFENSAHSLVDKARPLKIWK